MNIARELALAALEIGAIRLQPADPFTWTSGYRMPIYNDNRLLMGSYLHRELVAKGFAEIIDRLDLHPELIAGVATGGIAPATTLANNLKLPLAYVRDKPKAHGTGRQVEGRFYPGQKTVCIEDLISTGKSSIGAVIALREVQLEVTHCLSIFSYDFAEAKAHFTEINAQVVSLLTFPELLRYAAEAKKISTEEAAMLVTWSESPLEWGEKNGFPKR